MDGSSRISVADKQDHVRQWLGLGSINIFGTPLAGKDTQARGLRDWLGARIVSGGALLREGETSQTVADLIASGQLAPSEDYLSMMQAYLKSLRGVQQPLVLSAVGRWHGEEETIMQACQAAGHPIRAVLFLTLDEETVWQRFEAIKTQGDRGTRADDTPESLHKRLQEFREKTLQVKNYYQEKELLVEINGEQTPDQVADDILESLFARAT